MSKYSHIAGCKCASCRKIEKIRRRTGNSSWDHKSGCGCSRCRQIENLREQAELSKRIRESKRNGSSSRGSGSSGSGGCFLTTAACSYKGLPDDCMQLTILREFRDGYLLQMEGGRSMVDHYYAVAPHIVQALSEPGDFEFIWKCVNGCVEAINANRPDQAVDLYRDMVSYLEARAHTSLRAA